MSEAPVKIIYSMVRVAKVHKSTGKQVIRDISLSYFYGAKIGVLGLNGSGKSTLLRIMAGVDKEFQGEAHLSDGYTVGFLEQEPILDDTKTVKEIVQEGCAELVGLLQQFEDINMKLGSEDLDPEEMDRLITLQADVQDQIDRRDGWTLDDRLNFAMESLRCPPPDQIVKELSGGERRRVALTRLLLKEPDILLLDEPTNHLDAESVQWLERHLQNYKGTVIAVTHDRYFLDNVAGWILELDRGHGIPWKGNYSSWLEQKQKRLALEEKTEDKRMKNLERELEWIRMSPKARQAKSKARISAYETAMNQENDRAQDGEMKLYVPPGPRLGEVVIRGENLTMTYGDKLLYENFSFELPRGGIVGIIGPNGAGKTTLFRLVSGQEKPSGGKIVVGETVKLGYMEQSRMSLDSSKSVFETVSGGQDVIKLGKREINGRAYLGRFNFSGQDQQKSVADLSGGERNRVQLALLIREEANVILLDEPTNDLDINTLRALEDGLMDFPGCAVIISHDRWFLDRVATHIMAFEGDSKVVWFDGNYSDYEKNRKERLGKEADVPKRIKYAKLTR